MYPVLFAMLACQASVALAAFTLPVLAPEAAASLGVPASLVGYYTTVMLVGAMVSTMIAAGFVRRYGALRVSQVTVVFAAVGLLALPLAALTPLLALPLLVLSAIFLGLAYGPPNPASSHLLARVTPSHLRGRIFSIKQTSIPVGGALCGFALPLLTERIGWEGAALAAAAACLLLTVVLQPLRRKMDSDRSPRAPLLPGGLMAALGLVLRDPSLRLLGFMAGVFAAMQFCYLSLFVTFAVHRTGLSLVAIGAALSGGLTVSIFARMIWGWAADRFAPRLVLAALGLGMSSCAVAATTLDPTWPYAAVVALAVAFGSTATAWQGVYLAEIARQAPAEKVADATAGGMTITFFCALIGPAAFSALNALSGSDAAGFLLVGAVTFLFGLILLWGGRRPAGST
jgi:MFS family permease